MSRTWETTIRPVGNSIGVPITREVAEAVGLEKGTPVRLTSTPQGLLVTPMTRVHRRVLDLAYSEDDLLEGLAPQSDYIEGQD